jgi:GTP-binding protein
MFVDVARINVKGGDGGRGSNAVRREKFVPEGGPWGGDGGRGGDVIFVVDTGLNTLIDFKYRKHFKAERGEIGDTKGMHGKSGKDLIVKVPPGTVVKNDDTDEFLFDLTEPGRKVVVAKGGRGGRGNMRFATEDNKMPTFYEKGEPGEELWFLLELKVIADVGLVGFPNAGKSTFLSAVSAAKPKIANYPFTTLNPILGVVDVGDGRSFVLADIPGLIEGASEGIGLGHEFLRHVERTKVLIHVLDGAGTEGRDPLEDFAIIQEELRAFNEEMASRPTLVAFNKMDIPEAQENLPRVRDYLEGKGYKVFPISGATREGFRALLSEAATLIDHWQPPVEPKPEAERVYRAKENDWTIFKEDDIWNVVGDDMKRLVAMTMWENDEAVQRFLSIFRLKGVEKQLRAAGAEDGDTVQIHGIAFELRSDEQEPERR